MTSKANMSRMHTRGPTSMTSKLYSATGRGKTNAGGGGGGGEGGGKSSSIQVLFNGKICTPQSLLSRKQPKRDDVPKVHAAWMPTKAGEGAAGIAMTLDESSEFSEKSSQMSKMKSKADNTIREADARNTAGGKLNSVGSTVTKKVEVEEMVTVLLSETATETILFLPSFVAATDLREIAQVDERNARYEANVLTHKAGSADGGFVHRPTQTLNNPQKNQNDMAAPSALRDCGVQVMAYEITDADLDGAAMQYEGEMGAGADELGVDEKKKERQLSINHGTTVSGGMKSTSTGTGTDGDSGLLDLDRLSDSVKKFVSDTVTLSLVTPGCQLDTKDLSAPTAPGEGREARPGNARYTRAQRGGSVTQGVTGTHSGAAGHEKSSANQSRVSSDRDSEEEGVKFQRRKSRQGSVTGFTILPTVKKDDQSSGMQSGMVSSRMHSHDNGEKEEAWVPVELSEEETKQVLRDEEAERILSSKLLLKRLLMLERAVQQNAYHRQHLDYRDLPDVAPVNLVRRTKTGTVEGSSADHGHFGGMGGIGGLGVALGGNSTMGRAKSGAPSSPQGTTAGLVELNPSMTSLAGPGVTTAEGDLAVATSIDAKDSSSTSKVKKLFCYYSEELAQGRSVTCMAFNTVNTDLLAVGYGKLDNFVDNSRLGEVVDEQLQGGLVLFWSLRNPEHPEKVLRTPHPIMSLDFSKLTPMLLAVGLTNGDVNIYDVKREVDWAVPVHSSTTLGGAEGQAGVSGHTDPVCQLKWVVRRTERFERFETLISISNDGNVLEWNTKKGFVVSTLMQLKRAGMGDGWISRQAAGLSFDFVPSDPTVYVTGTEEGSLHRCSVSYNEQYLDTYVGHQGPVYRVKFSPRWHSVFLTCSADWSMGLYHIRSKMPLLTFSATGEHNAVNDIAWCPDNSTIFAAITNDAKLQIWDLSASSIDPVVVLDTAADDVLRTHTVTADLEGEEDGDVDDSMAGLMKGMRETSLASLSSSHGTLPVSPIAGPGAMPPAPGRRIVNSHSHLSGAVKSDVGNAPVARLMKALSQTHPSRSLTCLLFGEKSPTIVVGDNRGAVTVYRVLEPATITHEGPLQQMGRLKQAIRTQSDPSSAARLATLEGPVAGEDDDEGALDGMSVAGSAAGVEKAVLAEGRKMASLSQSAREAGSLEGDLGEASGFVEEAAVGRVEEGEGQLVDAQ